MPRARVMGEDGATREWKSRLLPAYQHRTKAADALIAGAYLAGTKPSRVRRALKAVFAGEVGKDVVSLTWRKVKGDWDCTSHGVIAPVLIPNAEVIPRMSTHHSFDLLRRGGTLAPRQTETGIVDDANGCHLQRNVQTDEVAHHG